MKHGLKVFDYASGATKIYLYSSNEYNRVFAFTDNFITNIFASTRIVKLHTYY